MMQDHPTRTRSETTNSTDMSRRELVDAIGTILLYILFAVAAVLAAIAIDAQARP